MLIYIRVCVLEWASSYSFAQHVAVVLSCFQTAWDTALPISLMILKSGLSLPIAVYSYMLRLCSLQQCYRQVACTMLSRSASCPQLHQPLFASPFLHLPSPQMILHGHLCWCHCRRSSGDPRRGRNQHRERSPVHVIDHKENV